jgi:hypothetical protein
MVGNVAVGGDAPVTVQTMTNTPTADAPATIDQIRRCEEAGADIIRVSCPDEASTAAFGKIVRAARVPLVADIHFHYKRALEAADAGAACLRINPGNIGSRQRIREVVNAAKAQMARAAEAATFNQRIRLSLDSLPVSVTVSNAEGELVHATPPARALLKLFGGAAFDLEAFYGQPLRTLFKTSQDAASFDRAVRSGETVERIATRARVDVGTAQRSFIPGTARVTKRRSIASRSTDWRAVGERVCSIATRVQGVHTRSPPHRPTQAQSAPRADAPQIGRRVDDEKTAGRTR